MKDNIDTGQYHKWQEKICHHPNLVIATGGDKICALCGRVVYSGKISSNHKNKTTNNF